MNHVELGGAVAHLAQHDEMACEMILDSRKSKPGLSPRHEGRFGDGGAARKKRDVVTAPHQFFSEP